MKNKIFFKNKKQTSSFLFKNKKASASATLTWMVASFIILFILIIFLIAVSLLDYRKGGISSERVLKTKEISSSLNNLMFVINMPVKYNGKETKMREIIGVWSLTKGNEKDLIKKAIEEHLKEFLKINKCYFFHAEYGLEGIKKGIEKQKETIKDPRAFQGLSGVIEANTIEFSNLFSTNDPRVSGYYEQRRENLLNNSPYVYIFSGGNKILIILYAGGC